MEIYSYLCIVNKTKEFFKSMKHNQLFEILRKAGCFISRHGKKHDEWVNPKTGVRCSVPRHGSHEMKKGTVEKILKQLLGR